MSFFSKSIFLGVFFFFTKPAFCVKLLEGLQRCVGEGAASCSTRPGDLLLQRATVTATNVSGRDVQEEQVPPIRLVLKTLRRHACFDFLLAPPLTPGRSGRAAGGPRLAAVRCWHHNYWRTSAAGRRPADLSALLAAMQRDSPPPRAALPHAFSIVDWRATGRRGPFGKSHVLHEEALT